jgi:hypothetical protein
VELRAPARGARGRIRKLTNGDIAKIRALFAMFEDFGSMLDIVTPGKRPA